MSRSRLLIIGLGYYGGLTTPTYSYSQLDAVALDVQEAQRHYIRNGYCREDITVVEDTHGRRVHAEDIMDAQTRIAADLQDGDSLTIIRLGHAVKTQSGPAFVVYPSRPKRSDNSARAARMREGLLLGEDMENHLYSLLPDNIQITLQIFNEACGSEDIDDPQSRLPRRLRNTDPLSGVTARRPSGSDNIPSRMKSTNAHTITNNIVTSQQITPVRNSDRSSGITVLSVYSCKDNQKSYGAPGKTVLRKFLDLDNLGSILNEEIGDRLLDGFLEDLLAGKGIQFRSLSDSQKAKYRVKAQGIQYPGVKVWPEAVRPSLFYFFFHMFRRWFVTQVAKMRFKL